MQTATRHRGRNEDGARLVLEVRDRLVAILLVHAAVQRKTVVAAAQQVTEQIVRLLLLVHEDQDEALIVPLAQDLQQTRELLFLRAYFDRLRHLRSHLRASAHDNHHRLVQDAARQVLHMRGERGGEHDQLPVRTRVLHDATDLRLEAHVQHAVRLVQHDVANALQPHQPALVQTENVDHATRRAHDDFAAALETVDLLRHRRAAVHRSDADAQNLAELGRLRVDLRHQLARGRENESDGSLALLHRRLVENVAEQRQQIRKRLSRTRLGDRDALATRHDRRNGLRHRRKTDPPDFEWGTASHSPAL